jgi:type III secretion system (T3SS) SseB-like protein
MFDRFRKRDVEVVRLLRGLRDDPATVPKLYESLFFARLWVLTQEAAPIERVGFLTYTAADGIIEVPVFTSPERSALRKLVAQSGATPVEFDGIALWPRLFEVVKPGDSEVAVDVGEPYGMRFRSDMILIMLRVHGNNVQLRENI